MLNPGLSESPFKNCDHEVQIREVFKNWCTQHKEASDDQKEQRFADIRSSKDKEACRRRKCAKVSLSHLTSDLRIIVAEHDSEAWARPVFIRSLVWAAPQRINVAIKPPHSLSAMHHCLSCPQNKDCVQ
jgi:hypothetical protein